MQQCDALLLDVQELLRGGQLLQDHRDVDNGMMRATTTTHATTTTTTTTKTKTPAPTPTTTVTMHATTMRLLRPSLATHSQPSSPGTP
jgi:hypothetical protein